LKFRVGKQSAHLLLSRDLLAI